MRPMNFDFDAQVTAALFDNTGAVFALGDGSVRFMKNSISLPTWMALHTVSGGEVISADSY